MLSNFSLSALPLPASYDDSFARFCLSRHAEDRYGAHPYDAHLKPVVSLLEWAGSSPVAVRAGWAHDLVEMGRATLDEITQHSCEGTSDTVWRLTGIGANRAERLLCVIPKIDGHRDAADAKTADRTLNMYKCIEDERWGLLSAYLKEHITLGPVLAAPGSPLRIVYEAIVDRAFDCLSVRHQAIQRSGRPRSK